jgi:hypothetical protein
MKQIKILEIMKKIIIAIVAFFAVTTVSFAQFSVNVNVGNNSCNEPPREVAYYYYPEIETYFDTYASVYIFYGPRGWMRSRYLPDYYRNYDVRNGYHVAIDYRGDAPFTYFDRHRERYYVERYYRDGYYGRRDCRRDNVVVVYEDNHRGRGKHKGNKHWRR